MRKLLFAALLPALPAFAQTPLTIELETVATGLGGMVDIAHANDDRLFIVLQPGVIRIVDGTGTVLPTPFLDIQARVNDSGNEQGLLGLAFDPNYQENGFFYVNYIYGTGNGTSRVSRFHVTDDANIGDPDSEQVLFSWPQPASNHNGGDLDFGPDGYLYVPFGDGGGGGDTFNNAQDLTDPLGDIVRLDVSDPDTTYTVPETNPFVGAGGDTLPEIWASGLRNPFRFGFDALTGDLWIGDVGQNAYEEVDFWPATNTTWPNFGWRCYEGDHTYNTAGCLPQNAYVPPVSEHGQSAFGWCSVMGGRVYRGSQSQRLQGHYLYTDYCGGEFFSLYPDGMGEFTRTEVYDVAEFGFTCIGEDNALEMYTGNTSSGILYHIVDPCPMAAPTVMQDGNVLTSSEATGNQWYMDGEPISGATGQSYSIEMSGLYYVVSAMGEGCELASIVTDYVWTGIAMQAMPGLEVYPVPADDRLIVEGLPTEVTTIALVDMAGRAVVTIPVANTARAVLTTAGVATGRYTLALYGADGLTLGQRPVSVLR